MVTQTVEYISMYIYTDIYINFRNRNLFLGIDLQIL